jgi:RimJ/RimL family protein N-acetyltransferase
MTVFLETERLVLRAFSMDDVDHLVDLDSDSDVMYYINGGRATPRNEIESTVLPRFISYYRDGLRYGFWAAIEKSTGQFLGWFHFRPGENSQAGEVAPADEPELGYRLRKAAWGKGYATEGSRALIDKGFLEQGVQRVTAGTMVVNSRSRRVMEKCGMTLVKIYHQEWPDYIEGQELGDVEYALTRADWERRQADQRTRS